ncbi:TPA: chromosome partitioning protein ParB [Escherichia coli]|uniref:Chromosome partitioning protein ParB n=1 Tax=Salmonella enterica subsp. enterica serovar Typhi str. CT18 TaxID=220341 RepID=A0A716SYI1_SALTI|nr:ParB family protein [Escherichia coli]HAD5564198.1 chromosome partitioning protein ParB [Salmonella enterica subsp. enterica serovar Typhi str. CT18]HEC6767237.1 ParB family protein [Salmonella enterica subsp. enterica serovar Virchow]EFD0435157.1 chromosome partitioning protein ParB [Escherichia coli]EFF2350528.1 chromosome partitioning protein ParB [Escherichia coli]EFH3063588.1 chromosome partitioning protein ParB [Escherichia coli]
MAHKPLNLGAAIMQPGRQASAAGNVVALGETPMILTLDQLRPNPDNPRTTRNPRYDDIKNSIHARGLDTVPKVTRIPDSEPDVYIFSDGGNTRYQILTELWKETGDPRFYRIHVLFKPWPGRLQCVIGHLAENEVRGELTFIEKAQGIHKARQIHEEQLGRKVSLRELADLLTHEGLPVHNSTISRMEDALKYLYPWIPDLMESGLGRHQVTALLALRQDAERVWGQFALASGTDAEFDRVFGESCRKFNSPELWSLEMFRDELIGDLLQALPHPSLDYDRWLLELDPKERNRRHHFGEPEPVVVPPSVRDSGTGQSGAPVSRIRPEVPEISAPDTEPEQHGVARPENAVSDTGLTEKGGLPSPEERADKASSSAEKVLRPEIQPDMYGGEPVFSGDAVEAGIAGSAVSFVMTGDTAPSGTPDALPASVTHFAEGRDDIEHLQNEAFRLAWELAESAGCAEEIAMDRESDLSAGFGTAEEKCSPVTAFLVGLTGDAPLTVSPVSLTDLLTGGSAPEAWPLLDDEHAVKLLRLLSVLRHLRALQRSVLPEDDEEDERDE